VQFSDPASFFLEFRLLLFEGSACLFLSLFQSEQLLLNPLSLLFHLCPLILDQRLLGVEFRLVLEQLVFSAFDFSFAFEGYFLDQV